MDIIKAIQTLEALASGCSPSSGEVIDRESVLNERDVIRALQIAIDQLKKPSSFSEVEISQGEIEIVIELFKNEKQKPNSSKMNSFFLGTKIFKFELIQNHTLYGKYKNVYSEGQLLDFFNDYFEDSASLNNRNEKERLYKQIDFFRTKPFNKLSDNAIKQLKEKINEIGILKKEHLSEYIVSSRIDYPRAYENWSEAEKELLKIAISYTNDLDLLSSCFQRGKSSIESCGQRIIYEMTNEETLH